VADGMLYLSMEYVDGGDLKERLGSALPAEEALEILAKIGDSLDYAHKRNIVHRDVKPGNILFRKDGTPLLTDFGIAKQVDIESELTSTGTVMGSPHYMSPEQAEGLPLDGRADIYSLGIIFYEMLTGKKAYHAESAVKIIMLHLQEPIPKLPAQYAAMQPLLEKMIGKLPAQRFATAGKMVEAVKEFQARYRSGPLPDGQEELRLVDPVTREADALVRSEWSGEVRGIRAKGWQGFLEELGRQKKPALVVGLLLAANLGMMLYDLIVPEWDASVPVDYYPAREGAGEAPDAALAVMQASSAGAELAEGALPDPDVMRALHWLARNSLEEFRLIRPENDNAWYYYKRILSLEPDNKGAQQGIDEIVARFIWMAEKQAEQGNLEQARRYTLMGLRVRPDSRELLSINARLLSAKQTFWDRVMQWTGFSADDD